MNDRPDSLSRTLGWALFISGIACYLLLSAPTLLRFGIPYDAPFGPVPAKIHPGSYLLLMALVVTLSSHGHPLRVLGRELRRQPLLSSYTTCMVLIFVWAVYRHGTSGAAFIIEALWMPAVAAYTLSLHDARRHGQTLQVIMVLIGCNAVVAIGESLLKTRLTPLYIGREDAIADYYFRASAFLGHPLANALVTVTLLPAVTMLPWKLVWRVALAVALMLSVLAFGGRASLVGGLVVYGAMAAWKLSSDAVHGRYSYLKLTGGLLALMLGATALVGVVAATGLGERIFQNLQLDNSAGVRVRVWEAFDHVSTADLLVGVPPARIDDVAVKMGLDPLYEAIENYWIYLSLFLGLIGFVPFVVGLACLGFRMWRIATPAMRGAIFLFLVAGSTANTLAAKTVSLSLLVTAIVAGAGQSRTSNSRRPDPPLQVGRVDLGVVGGRP